jgi:hypothetical protein
VSAVDVVVVVVVVVVVDAAAGCMRLMHAFNE